MRRCSRPLAATVYCCDKFLNQHFLEHSVLRVSASRGPNIRLLCTRRTCNDTLLRSPEERPLLSHSLDLITHCVGSQRTSIRPLYFLRYFGPGWFNVSIWCRINKICVHNKSSDQYTDCDRSGIAKLNSAILNQALIKQKLLFGPTLTTTRRIVS